jgi:hypothetical protein
VGDGDDVLDAVHLGEVLEHHLGRDLADAVRVDGLRGHVFGEGHSLGAVASHWRAEDDAAHTRGDGSAEDARGGGHDVLRDEVRAEHARPFVRGRGRVVDDVDAARQREHLLPIVAVHAVELNPFGDVVLVATEEVVATDDFVALGEKVTRQVAPKEARNTGDEDQPTRHALPTRPP